MEGFTQDLTNITSIRQLSNTCLVLSMPLFPINLKKHKPMSEINLKETGFPRVFEKFHILYIDLGNAVTGFKQTILFGTYVY